MVQVKGLQGARVGGQGFDPCLVHNIFLNISLQIPCYHSKQAHPTLPYHHHWIIQGARSNASRMQHMVDTPGINTLDSMQRVSSTSGLGTNSTMHPAFSFHTGPSLYFSILVLILIILLIIFFYKNNKNQFFY